MYHFKASLGEKVYIVLFFAAIAWLLYSPPAKRETPTHFAKFLAHPSTGEVVTAVSEKSCLSLQKSLAVEKIEVTCAPIELPK